jgi:hypothetical protein
MISLNDKDEMVEKVGELTKLNKFVTKFNYRVYGLKQKGNPPVLIEFTPAKFKANQFEFLAKFFKEKKIETGFAPTAGKDKHDIYIGLRMDLRKKNSKVCAAIVKTVVHYLENKLKM